MPIKQNNRLCRTSIVNPRNMFHWQECWRDSLQKAFSCWPSQVVILIYPYLTSQLLWLLVVSTSVTTGPIILVRVNTQLFCQTYSRRATGVPVYSATKQTCLVFIKESVNISLFLSCHGQPWLDFMLSMAWAVFHQTAEQSNKVWKRVLTLVKSWKPAAHCGCSISFITP